MQGLIQIYRKAALGSDPGIHLTTQGNLILVFKVFPHQQGNSDVLLCDGS